MWSIFFIVAELANLYVAGKFFAAEQAFITAAGQAETALDTCNEVSSKELLNLYLAARSREEAWVNFKLFGMMGLTIAFVVAQAFYLARHISDLTDP